jgi:hypothetical protein
MAKRTSNTPSPENSTAVGDGDVDGDGNKRASCCGKKINVIAHL